jgi:hypothetical protein
MMFRPVPFAPPGWLRRTPSGSTSPTVVPATPDARSPLRPPLRVGPFGPPRRRYPASDAPLPVPGVPYAETPADGEVVAAAPVLTWISLYAQRYDIKFGTVNPPVTIVSADQLAPFRLAVAPDPGIYYWQVIAKNTSGSTAGPVQSFRLDPAPATVLDAATLYDQHVSSLSDISQVRTRVFVKGAGSTLVHDEPANKTTLELQDTSMFSANGGKAIVGPWVITYTGKIDSLVGDGADAGGATSSNAPAAPSAVIATDVAGQIVSGRVKQPCFYKYTNVVVIAATGQRTESELSNPSNTVAVYPYQVTNVGDGSAGLLTPTTGGQLDPGAYTYHVSAVTADGEAYSGGGFSIGTVTITAPNNAVQIDFKAAFVPSDPRITQFHVWRTSHKYTGVGGTPLFLLLTTVAPNGPSLYLDQQSDDTLSTFAAVDANGLQFNGYNTTGAQTVLNVPVGPTGTVARNIYRAKLGLFTGILDDYVQIGTINNNLPSSGVVTSGDVLVIADGIRTVFIDNVDSGYPLFTGDSSGAAASGATGAGAAAQPPPLHHILVGVSGLRQAVTAGTPVNIWVQRDDETAQIALAQLEGGDGIHEYLVTDTTLITDAMCVARGDAELALFSRPIQTVRFSTRDTAVAPGKMITFNLAHPPIAATLLIQSVTVDWVRRTPQDRTFAPRRNVIASSVRFSLTDLLRKALLLP